MPLTPHDEDLVLMPSKSSYDDAIATVEGMEAAGIDPTIVYHPLGEEKLDMPEPLSLRVIIPVSIAALVVWWFFLRKR